MSRAHLAFARVRSSSLQRLPMAPTALLATHPNSDSIWIFAGADPLAVMDDDMLASESCRRSRARTGFAAIPNRASERDFLGENGVPAKKNGRNEKKFRPAPLFLVVS